MMTGKTAAAELFTSSLVRLCWSITGEYINEKYSSYIHLKMKKSDLNILVIERCRYSANVLVKCCLPELIEI